MSHLYETPCECPQCSTGKSIALATDEPKFKRVLNAALTAFKRLHKNGSYKPEDLFSTKAYKKLINEISDVFSSAIKDNDVPQEMAKALNEDVFIFSALKTHAQLFEASRLLTKDDGTIKGYTEFAKDFNKINPKYNQQYLESEYQFAISSSQSAGNWAGLQEDTEKYTLQYRTAEDNRVRASHQALSLITLPKDDPFWSSYYPPNGWKCRCTAVEALSQKYKASNSDEAIKLGEKATTNISESGKNKLAMFRFNPGKEKLVFPPDHPYNKVKGAKEVRTAASKK